MDSNTLWVYLDNATGAAPQIWRHYKRGPKEMIIIGSFGNHEDWPIKQLVNKLYTCVFIINY